MGWKTSYSLLFAVTPWPIFLLFMIMQGPFEELAGPIAVIAFGITLLISLIALVVGGIVGSLTDEKKLKFFAITAWTTGIILVISFSYLLFKYGFNAFNPSFLDAVFHPLILIILFCVLSIIAYYKIKSR